MYVQLAARAQEAPGGDDGRFGFGAFAARYQPENFNGEDTGWRDWSRVFRTGQDDVNEDECKKHQWRHDLEMRLQWLSWMFDSRISRTDSLLQWESVENCPDQQRRRRI